MPDTSDPTKGTIALSDNWSNGIWNGEYKNLNSTYFYWEKDSDVYELLTRPEKHIEYIIL